MEVTSMTSDSSGDPLVRKGGTDLPCADEASSEGNLGGGLPLKKGPWTSTEDAILVDYVTKHGEGNWNAVQKHSGLARCGKSCRLRWANHLRPDLRKGAFTPEEERRIVELHAKMGNKWARMSLELPGRTDNEIKNYWNTRIKRRQRAGLPIYPPDVCLQTYTENKCENVAPFSSGNAQHPDLLPIGGFEFPAVEFKGLDVNCQFYSFPTVDIPSCNLLDNIPASGMLAQGVNSSYSSKSSLSTFHPPKRFRRSESILSSISPDFSSSFTDCNKIHRDGSVPNLQSLGISSDYHQNLRSDLSSSHGFHGIPSFSGPTWAMKLELPSLQIPTETRTGSWGQSSSPLPSLESLDNLIQSPPEHTETGNFSPRNSGLLDAVLYESQSLRNIKSDPCDQKSNVSVVHEEGMDHISYDQHEAEWELYPDPISPLGHSSASVFSIYTPVSGSSLDEAQSFETFPGSKLNTERMDVIPTELDRKDEISNSNGLMFSRPDFMLASDCLGLQTDRAKELHVERYNWGTTW